MANKIGVLLAEQNPAFDSPKHFASKWLASQLIADSWAKQISPKVIWLKVKQSWGDVKRRFTKPTLATPIIPKILPPRSPEALTLSYPPKNYESDGRRKQALLWMSATRF